MAKGSTVGAATQPLPPRGGGIACRMPILRAFVCLILVVSFPAALRASTPGSVFHAREPIRLELKVNVVLVGLNGDGAFGYRVEESSLASLLGTVLPSYRPSLIEEERLLNVEYHLRYDVHHQRTLASFTNVLAEELRSIGGGAHVSEYAVPLTGSGGLKAYFDSISVADEYSIIILNPCKRTLDGMLHGRHLQEEPTWQYHYTYNDAPTQTWISEGRYVVVDLSAGPVVYGPSEAGEGAVTAASLPRISKFAEKLKQALQGKEKFYSQYTVSKFAEIEAHLATTVISAIQHVFVPDIQYPTIQADKILVPIIVLRNHVEFNPWEQGHPYSIDIDTIRREIEKLALPNQELTIVTDMHGLHEHKHISLALAKAHKTDTVHEPTVPGRYRAKEKPYIDGRALLQQMKDAEDVITTGFLLSSEERAHMSAFFSRSQPAADETTLGSERASQARPLGTRILPVYVFSLLLSPHLHNALLDRNSLYTAFPEGVVVLQTNSTNVPVPFFTNNKPVLFHPNNPTRHIIAGVATALGSISSPLQRYSTMHHRVLHSHLWANGHHPFGPYSTSSGLSRIFVDQMIRNSVISRLDQALKMIYKSVVKVDKFAKRYLYDPYGENVTITGFEGKTLSSGGMGAIEDAAHGTTPDIWQGWESEQIASYLPLPVATVERLYADMNRLGGLFGRIGELLRDYKLNEAYEVSNSVGLGAITFAQYVQDEIRAAEAELLCCYLRHTPTHSSPVADMLQYLLVFVVAVLFMLALLFFLKRTPRAKQTLHRSTKRL